MDSEALEPESLEERAFEMYAHAKRTVYRIRRDPRATAQMLAMATQAERVLFATFLSTIPKL